MFGGGFGGGFADFGGKSNGFGSSNPDRDGMGGRGDGNVWLNTPSVTQAPVPVPPPAPFSDLMTQGLQKAQAQALAFRQGIQGAPQGAMPQGVGILAPSAQPPQMGGVLGGVAQSNSPYAALIAQLSDYRTR